MKDCASKGAGTKRYLSKLTPQQILDIRAEFKPYKITREMLADKYNVSTHVIERILLGQTCTNEVGS